MSQNLDFYSVTWEVQIPVPVTPSSSKDLCNRFQFKTLDWFMDCGERNGCIFLDVWGVQGSDAPPGLILPGPDAPWDIYIMVRDGEGSGRVLENLCQKDWYHRSKKDKTWQRRIWEIEIVYPQFRMKRQLTFTVTIVSNVLGSQQPGTPSTHTQMISTSCQTQTIPFSPTTAANDKSSVTATIPCLANLSKDFAKLLDDESDPDVEFHCDTHTTKAHKTVVCARSPVLAKMLKSSMSEGKTGIVKIQDMDADTFRQLLRYLYTGQLVELTFETAVPIYEAADQYEVLALASRCSEFITKNLTSENAYDVLVVADAHSDQKFVETVVDYMARNTFPMTSDRWSGFCDEQPKLSNKVFKRFCEVSKWNGLKE